MFNEFQPCSKPCSLAAIIKHDHEAISYSSLSKISFDCVGQMNEYVYPTVSTVGNKQEDFIPKDWKAIKKVSFDFNRDGLLDFALVIQKVKSIQFDNSNYFPQLLLIVFQKTNKTYRLNSSTFKIFGEGNWGINDQAFVNIGLQNSSLKITFCTGGTERAYMNYYFKYKNKQWLLTEYMDEIYQVASKDLYVTEINFSTVSMETYIKLHGEKIVDRKRVKPDETFRLNNITSTHIKLVDIDASTFIDPFKG